MDLEEACHQRGLRMGEYRRSILRSLAGDQRHASVDQIHQAIRREHAGIRLATVYRTVGILEEAGVLVRVDLGDGVARYEAADQARHDHLIDQRTGTVIEFHDERIPAILHKIAASLGYDLAGYRLNLYGLARRADAAADPESLPARRRPAAVAVRRTDAGSGHRRAIA